MTIKSETLAFYRDQIQLSRHRIRLFETAALSPGIIGPPAKDNTHDAIDLEKAVIANLRRGIDLLERTLDSRKPDPRLARM